MLLVTYQKQARSRSAREGDLTTENNEGNDITRPRSSPPKCCTYCDVCDICYFLRSCVCQDQLHFPSSPAAHLPLIARTKPNRLLMLGQRLCRPPPALVAAQREVLELWRCCLSYGIDVAVADTVVLVARAQGWWPGLAARPPPPLPPLPSSALSGAHSGAASSAVEPAEFAAAAAAAAESTFADDVDDALHGGEHTEGGRMRRRGGSGGDVDGAAADRSPFSGTSGVEEQDPTGLASTEAAAAAAVPVSAPIPPVLAFYRSLHQLACVCVPPPGRSGNPVDGNSKGGGGGGPSCADAGATENAADAGRGGNGRDNRTDFAAESCSAGGVAVDPKMWADIGDTVDAAVEASVRWLSTGGSRAGGGSGGGEGGRNIDGRGWCAKGWVDAGTLSEGATTATVVQVSGCQFFVFHVCYGATIATFVRLRGDVEMGCPVRWSMPAGDFMKWEHTGTENTRGI